MVKYFSKCVLIALCAVLVGLSGCGSKKIDTSSPEATKASVEAVTKSMTPEKKAEFEAAMMTIMMDGIDLSSASNPELLQKSMTSKVDGKSPDEVIAAAKEIRKARAAKQMQTVLQQIKDLEAKREAANAAKSIVAGFVVEKSAFYFSKERFSSGPVIELKVKNGTKYPVSSVRFKATLETPGRAIPWVKENVYYTISGGLESGESAEWKLAPNQFGEWGSAPRDRNDMVLTVEVTKLEGADESVIADTEFDTDDEQRIAELKELLKKIESQ